MSFIDSHNTSSYRNGNSKSLFLIGGNPAIGKTEVSRSLARKAAYPLLDKDTLLSPFVEHIQRQVEEEHLWDSKKHEETVLSLKDPVYSALLNAGHEAILYGADGFVAVSPFSHFFKNDPSADNGRNKKMEEIRLRAAESQYNVIAVWLVLSDSQEHRRRMETRGWHLDENKLEDFDEWLAAEPKPEDVSENADLVVDIVDRDSDEIADQIMTKTGVL